MTMLFANNIDWAAVNCSTFTFKPALLVATAGETVVIRTRSWTLQFQLEYTWLPVSPCCEYVVCCYYSVICWHTWSIFDTSSHTAFYLMTLAVLNPHFISKDRCQVHWYHRSRALQRIQPFDRPLYFVVRGPIPMKFKCSCGCRSTALCWCGYCDFMYRTSPTQRYKCWNAVSVRLGLKNKIPRIHLCLLVSSSLPSSTRFVHTPVWLCECLESDNVPHISEKKLSFCNCFFFFFGCI